CRRIADLLQIAAKQRGFDYLEVCDPAERTRKLDPSAIHSGNDPIQLAVSIVRILRIPEIAAQGVERHAETIAVAIGEDLLNVGANLASHCGANGEERIVRGRGSILVHTQNDTG